MPDVEEGTPVGAWALSATTMKWALGGLGAAVDAWGADPPDDPPKPPPKISPRVRLVSRRRGMRTEVTRRGFISLSQPLRTY